MLTAEQQAGHRPYKTDISRPLQQSRHLVYFSGCMTDNGHNFNCASCLPDARLSYTHFTRHRGYETERRRATTLVERGEPVGLE